MAYVEAARVELEDGWVSRHDDELDPGAEPVVTITQLDGTQPEWMGTTQENGIYITQSKLWVIKSASDAGRDCLDGDFSASDIQSHYMGDGLTILCQFWEEALEHGSSTIYQQVVVTDQDLEACLKLAG